MLSNSSTMLRLVLTCLLGVSGIYAAATKNDTRALEKFTRMAGGQPETDAANTAFIAYISDANSYFGNGIIINKYFIVTPADLAQFEVSPMPSVLTAEAHCLDPASTSTDCVAGGGQIRTIVEVINYGGANCPSAMVDCLSLARVCPSWPASYFTMPLGAVKTEYKKSTTKINLYQYANAGAGVLQKATKNIGEYCECADITGWDDDKHICLEQHATIFGEDPDDIVYGTIITGSTAAGLASEYLGFIVKTQDATGVAGGEVVIWLGDNAYQSWFTNDADATVYEYPV